MILLGSKMASQEPKCWHFARLSITNPYITFTVYLSYNHPCPHPSRQRCNDLVIRDDKASFHTNILLLLHSQKYHSLMEYYHQYMKNIWTTLLSQNCYDYIGEGWNLAVPGQWLGEPTIKAQARSFPQCGIYFTVCMSMLCIYLCVCDLILWGLELKRSHKRLREPCKNMKSHKHRYSTAQLRPPYGVCCMCAKRIFAMRWPLQSSWNMGTSIKWNCVERI